MMTLSTALLLSVIFASEISQIAAECKDNEIEIDSICCPEDTYVAEDGKCHCEMNKQLVDGVCQCVDGLEYNEIRKQCVPDASYYSCRCPINSVLADDGVSCECLGDLEMDVASHQCLCPQHDAEQHGTTCCPQSTRFSSETSSCECIGDLKMNETTKQCECESQLKRFGTVCCRQDQIEVNGECKCFMDMMVDDDAASADSEAQPQCICTEQNKQKCCDHLSDAENFKILVYNDLERRCTCQSPHYFETSSGKCCRSSTMREADDGSGECVCKNGAPLEYKLNEAECKCPADMRLVNGKCQCQGDTVRIEGTCACPKGQYLADHSTHKCCRNDQMFNHNSQQCSCPEELSEISNEDGSASCKCPQSRFYNPFTSKCECLHPQVDSNGTCACPHEGMVIDGSTVCCDEFETYDHISKSCFSCPDRFIWDQNSCQKCPLGFTRNPHKISECIATKYMIISGILAFVLLVCMYLFVGIAISTY